MQPYYPKDFVMTNCIPISYQFSRIKNRKIEINFSGGEISSDGGLLLLREADRKLRLTDALAVLFPDKRNPYRIRHSTLTMLKQRIYGIALGYEDLNDHDKLRKCSALQTASERLEDMASSATLCRFENGVDRNFIVEAHKVIINKFIESFTDIPKELA